MFVGIELRRQKDASGKGWYRIAPAIIRQDGDEAREARTFRGITTGIMFAGLLIGALTLMSAQVPDPIIQPTVTFYGVIYP